MYNHSQKYSDTRMHLRQSQYALLNTTSTGNEILYKKRSTANSPLSCIRFFTRSSGCTNSVAAILFKQTHSFTIARHVQLICVTIKQKCNK